MNNPPDRGIVVPDLRCHLATATGRVRDLPLPLSPAQSAPS
ncbi:hypothetical protein ABT061_47010 [Streptosporangium sp. NPDC002544]